MTTIQPHQIPRVLEQYKPVRVMFEDSRLQSKVWNTAPTLPAKLKIARNVGEIDAWCSLITAVCGDLRIAAHGIKPLDKGRKLPAATFAHITSWSARSNQHERDAAMVAWPYRTLTLAKAERPYST